MRATIDRDTAFKVAARLMSEDDENVEYDRALVELLSDAFGSAAAASVDSDTLREQVQWELRRERDIWLGRG